METGTKFNIALLVFYIPYILVDVPSNWIIKRIRAGIYLPALITAWGVVSTFLGFTKSFGGLVAARFFLGAFEGGLLGGIIVYLAMFYRRHEILWTMGMFYCAAPLSGAFGGLLATGLATIRYNGYNRWPWIFFSRLFLLSSPLRTILISISETSRGNHNDSLWDYLFLFYATHAGRCQVSHRRGANSRHATSERGCTRCYKCR
jgi:MFS family permease